MTVSEGILRQFDTGATRNSDVEKFDYEGFLSPSVLERYAAYMHAHRHQRDGTLRDSDNWQKGIPQATYMKSLVRHVMELWHVHRGGTVLDPDNPGVVFDKDDLCCAIMFNVMGYLHESLKDAHT